MGKQARRTKRPNGVQSLDRADRLRVLLKAAGLLNQLNNGAAHCVPMASCLLRCAQLLNIRADVVPVALAIQGPVGGVLMGQALAGLAKTVPDVVIGDISPGWQGAGHVIVHLPQDDILIDVTLDQTSTHTGLKRGVLIQEDVPRDALDHPNTDDQGLTLGLSDGEICYKAAPEDTSWQTHFNNCYAAQGRNSRLAVRRALELNDFDEELQPLH
jgi:hypothetical protein